jgi:tetratricopeptide (TPR) repeat protein
MLRIASTASLALALGLAPFAHALTPTEVFERTRLSVPVVETLATDGRILTSSSAIALGEGRFVAMCSPLDGSDAIRLNAAGHAAAATLVARDTQRNLCLLSAPDAAALPAMALVGQDAPPQVGARIFAVSNALGFGTGLSEGVISGIRRRDGGELLQFSAPISPGSEGGALVDVQGRLLGVIDYRQRDGQNVNFAAPAGWIAEIEQRRDQDAQRRALRDRAPRLAREAAGKALGELAHEWTTRYPDDADGWSWLAIAARMNGDFVAEEAAWRRAQRLDPDAIVPGLGIAEALLRQRRFAEARDAAQGLLSLRQENAAVWTLLGQAHDGLQASAPAEEAYRRALSLDPWQTPAHAGLIALARQRGDRAAAIAGWTNLVRLYPDRAEVHWGLVESLLIAEEGARAHAVLARLPPEMAGSGDALFWKGATSALLERPQEAIGLFRDSLARAPADPARVGIELGKAYLVLQRFPEAIAALREAVRLAPGLPEPRYWLAIALKDGGHVAEALEIDRKLVADYPDDASAWRQLGFAHASAAMTGEAIAALERSLAIDPAQPRVWNALTVLYRAAGRHADVLRAHANLRGLDAAMAETAYRATIAPWEVRPQ